MADGAGETELFRDAPAQGGSGLIVDVDGFEGPLDLLLSLARTQKVDLRQVSVLQLAEQYLAFVERVATARIELAADYLVMAAWLAYLKSRLLLPQEPEADGPSGDEMAAHLAFQLERLEAMRAAAAQLMARDRVGRDVFARGEPQEVTYTRRVRPTTTLLDLMQGYARLRTRDAFQPYAVARDAIFPIEAALERLRALIGDAVDWAELMQYLPEEWCGVAQHRRSATAATFAAALELAKSGEVVLRQETAFAPLELCGAAR